MHDRVQVVAARCILGLSALACVLLSGLPRLVTTPQVSRPLPAGCTPFVPGTPVLESPGTYCFTQDVHQAAGIVITSSDVVLDLNGYCLFGDGDDNRISQGIQIASPLSRVTIRNGCIAGFMFGVHGVDSTGVAVSSDITVEHLRLRNNSFRGVKLGGVRLTVDRTVVEQTGGTTVYPDAFAMGIELRGHPCQVSRSIVTDVYPMGVGEGVGISISDDGEACAVIATVVHNRRIPRWGRTFGIWAPSAPVLERNVVQTLTFGIAANNLAGISGNASLDESCIDEHGSISLSKTDTWHMPGSRLCSENLDTALSQLLPGSSNSLFRVASIYEMRGDWSNAVIYYHAAARLGSAEARRVIRRIVSSGKLSEEGADAAVERGRALGLY